MSRSLIQNQKPSCSLVFRFAKNINYLVGYLDSELEDLNSKLKEFEENDDAAYADQTRKKIVEYTAVREKYSALKTSLENK